MRKKHRAAIGLLAMLMLAALIPISAAGAEEPAVPTLFAAAAEGRADTGVPAEATRSRLVTVDTAELFDGDGKARSAAAMGRVQLDLFPDVSYTGIVEEVSADGGASTGTWYGSIEGVPDGYFYLVVVDGTLIAHIASSQGIYEVSWAGDGLYRAVQIDQSMYEDHPEGTVDGTLGLPTVADLVGDDYVDEVGADAEGRLYAGRRLIDIMVMYTATTRAVEGSTAAMKARIQLALEETNQAYANAGISPRLRLVHVEEVVYAESGDLFTDLPRLYNGTNGLEGVAALRDLYGADMVALIVEDGGSYCGLAAGILPSSTFAYQVTARTCATGYYSFGHEFGHLQGARHDMYVDSTTGSPYDYNHGFVWTDDRWRTVMAYNTLCNDTSPFTYCTRLQWFSNPNRYYNADKMGDADSINRLALNNTAATVDSNRADVIARDFYSSFNTDHGSWSQVTGQWSINPNGQYESHGVPNASAAVRRWGTFGDVTFEASLRRVGCQRCANRIIIRGDWTTRISGLWRPSYVFEYANSGMFSVWKVKPGGTLVKLAGWTEHAAITPGGWNKLKVVASGEDMKFYINDQLVWQGSDSDNQVGTIGIGFHRIGGVSNTLFINWAKADTTAAADAGPGEAVVAGTPKAGGTIAVSPAP